MADMETVFHYRPIDPTFRSGGTAIEEKLNPGLTNLAEFGLDTFYPNQDGKKGVDWTAITLSILALISLLGLIPLWYLVFLRYNG